MIFDLTLWGVIRFICENLWFLPQEIYYQTILYLLFTTSLSPDRSIWNRCGMRT